MIELSSVKRTAIGTAKLLSWIFLVTRVITKLPLCRNWYSDWCEMWCLAQFSTSRYRYVVFCVVMQRNKQMAGCFSRVLWNAETDRSMCFQCATANVLVCCIAYALYKEWCLADRIWQKTSTYGLHGATEAPVLWAHSQISIYKGMNIWNCIWSFECRYYDLLFTRMKYFTVPKL